MSSFGTMRHMVYTPPRLGINTYGFHNSTRRPPLVAKRYLEAKLSSKIKNVHVVCLGKQNTNMGQNEKTFPRRPRLVHLMLKRRQKHHPPFYIIPIHKTNLEYFTNSFKYKSGMARSKSGGRLENMDKIK